eukprot:3177271-Pyramimonas_sp.AAC.1
MARGRVRGRFGSLSESFREVSWELLGSPGVLGASRSLLGGLLGASWRPLRRPWAPSRGSLGALLGACLLYTSPSPRDRSLS